MKNLAFVFLISTISLTCNAEPYLYESGTYKFKAENVTECYNLGTSSPQLHVCQNHFKDLSKKRLDSSNNNLLSKLTRDKQKFINAQAKWVEFANLQCQFEAQASEAYSKPYNAHTEITNICMDTLRVSRSLYLNKIDTGCAGCVQ